jgi:hypothetical protein
MALVPVTQVRVYNRALALVGSVNRSTNTNDGKPWTDTLNEHWATAVRELLAAHPWNCAIKRATLNKGAAPDWGDGYSYQLPADCLRWLPQAKDSGGCDLAASREGGALVADGGAQIFIRYIALIEDLTAWAPHMVSALGYRLAYDAAEALTQSSAIVEAMRVKYEGQDSTGGYLAEAKAIDGLETGDRDRGNVVVRSRTLSAALGSTSLRAPGT